MLLMSAQYFQACDLEHKGYLTEEDLNKALERVIDPHGRTEIKKIFGVLNSSSARVNLETFKQKVFEFSRSNLGEDKENDNEGEVSNNNNLLNIRKDKEVEHFSSRSFKPNFISSPSPAATLLNVESQRLFLHEDTFESNGEDNNSHLSDMEDSDISFSRTHRLRLSFRGSRRFSRRNSPISISESPSPTNVHNDFANLNTKFNNDINFLKRQLCEKHDLVTRCEEELTRESYFVKTLEEKLEMLENTNKELNHELENSKFNIKNLEAHMMFLDEKLISDSKDIECQKQSIEAEREKLNLDIRRSVTKELELDEKNLEFENWKSEMLSQNHILQSIILELKKDNKKLTEDLENLNEKVVKLNVENFSLKQSKLSMVVPKSVNTTIHKQNGMAKSRQKIPIQRQYLYNLLIKLLLRSGLTCVRECLIYLHYMLRK